MKQIDIIAGWTQSEEQIGILKIDRIRGKEIVSVELARNWLKNHAGLWLDPDLHSFGGAQFPPVDKELFGFLSDASPDRWGRKLIDRSEKAEAEDQNRQVRTMLPTDYLLGVSDDLRYGGLRFKDARTNTFLKAGKETVPPLTDLRMLEAASRGLESSYEDKILLHMLLNPGSSLGGARPKANVRDTNGDLWIAKFPSKNDDHDIGAWEMVEHDLAKRCGINVPDAMCKKLSDRGTTFLSKRFDRESGQRIHLMSAMTALGKTDRNTDGTGYIEIAEQIETISSQPEKDLQELWRRMAFNVLTSNCDDHLRNHGFILENNSWHLSPAYDLNPDQNNGFLSLQIAPGSNERNLKDLVTVSDFFRIPEKESKEILDEMRKTIRNTWAQAASRYGICDAEIGHMSHAFALCSDTPQYAKKANIPVPSPNQKSAGNTLINAANQTADDITQQIRDSMDEVKAEK